MGIYPRRTELFQFDLDGLSEQVALEARHVSSGHCGLIDPVQHAGNTREEIRLENLAVFDQAEWVPGEEANAAADRNAAELVAALSYGSVIEGVCS